MRQLLAAALMAAWRDDCVACMACAYCEAIDPPIVPAQAGTTGLTVRFRVDTVFDIASVKKLIG
ncbi:hypothetical protein [Massilia genomosp. 1]|uniref:hypothetical protein n=1 Tax=Massilia genomosp. 1 TaxID=2609280 RepID=UPI001421953C|nr:hypothetical protein [Massilia genomosp. 1]